MSFSDRLPKFLKAAIRIWTKHSLPLTLATILLLFLLLLSYSYLSVHILSIGDWPHDVLKPLYGTSSFQTGWASSLGLVPQNRLDRFEVIVADSSIKDYLEEEPWKSRLLDFVSGGGTLVKISAKDSQSGGEILSETRWGEGRIIEVRGTANPAYQGANWKSAQTFWTGIFRSSTPAYRWALLQSVKILLIIGALITALCLLFRGEKVLRRQDVTPEEYRETSRQIATNQKLKLFDTRRWLKSSRKHILVGLGLLFFSFLLILPLLIGWWQGKIPWFDEVAHSLGAIQYYVDYLQQYHSLPLTWDSYTYSQPMDLSYYLRTPVAIVPAVISLILGITPAGSLILSGFIFIFLAMCAIYYCVYKHTRSTMPAMLAVILYFLSLFAIHTLRTSELRLVFQMSLIPLLWLCLDWYLEAVSRKRAALALVLSVAIFTWLITINAVIAVVALASLLLVVMEVYGLKGKLPRLSIVTIACGGVVLAYLLFTQALASFYETPIMTIDDYVWDSSPNLLQALTLGIAQSNGMPAELSSVGVNRLYTIVLFLPLVLSTISTAYTKKYLLAYVSGIMLLLLSMGLYGPLSWLYLYFPLPFRATGRTLMPIASLIFSFLAALGAANLLAEHRILHTVKQKLFLASLPYLAIMVIFGVGLSTTLRYVSTYKVPAEIEWAYDSIPAGSQVLVLPMHGPLDFGYSNSSPGATAYKGNASVGWFIAYLHTYEVGKHHLKDVYAPMSRWEVPFMTEWYFNMVQQKIAYWSDTVGTLKLLDYAPDLEYLIVYKKLLPSQTLGYLNQADQLTKTYENELMAVYRKEQATPAPILESEKAYLLYPGSYQYSLPSVNQLAGISIPVILGQTPWYSLGLEEAQKMDNLTVITQDLNLEDIAREYAVRGMRNKIIINPEDSLSFSEENWHISSFWQPLQAKYGIFSHSWQPFEVSFQIDNAATYDILIRTISNGPWQGNLLISLDNRTIGEGYFPLSRYGGRWFEVKTAELYSGKHTLSFRNTEPLPVDVDAVAIVEHTEYEEQLQIYEAKLRELVAEKDYLGIYEAETSFTSPLNASVVDDWSNDYSQYPSGGWPRGGSMKLSPPHLVITKPAEFIVNKEITTTEDSAQDGKWQISPEAGWAYLNPGESSPPLEIVLTGLEPNHRYTVQIGIWSEYFRTAEFIQGDYHQALDSPQAEPFQISWLPIQGSFQSDAQGRLSFRYGRGADLSKPSSIDAIRLIAESSSLSLPMDIPISQEYYLTARHKGEINLKADGEYLSPLGSYSSSGWTHTVYKKSLSQGTHLVVISNDSEPNAWIDVVYVSSRPLSEITSNSNYDFTLKMRDPSNYQVDSATAQPRYVLLMKSYIPSWRLLSAGKEGKAYLANGFLTAFYVENQHYSIRFKP